MEVSGPISWPGLGNGSRKPFWSSLGPFSGLGSDMVPGGLFGALWVHFLAWAWQWLQEACLEISGPLFLARAQKWLQGFAFLRPLVRKDHKKCKKSRKKSRKMHLLMVRVRGFAFEGGQGSKTWPRKLPEVGPRNLFGARVLVPGFEDMAPKIARHRSQLSPVQPSPIQLSPIQRSPAELSPLQSSSA